MTNSVSTLSGASMTPDSLLEYCQMQLGDLDDQTTSQMNLQELQLSERTAVENVQTTLETFGDQGPQNAQGMESCIGAFQTAIQSLPPGDPVAAQLTTQMQQMETQYGYQPAYTSLPINSPAAQVQSVGRSGIVMAPTTPPVATYHPSTLTNPPQNDDWKGTTDAAGNLADDIKSQSEIEMLTLQDLVSQRQQVVELATGMMSKEDEALEDGAKAIGQ